MTPLVTHLSALKAAAGTDTNYNSYKASPLCTRTGTEGRSLGVLTGTSPGRVPAALANCPVLPTTGKNEASAEVFSGLLTWLAARPYFW